MKGQLSSLELHYLVEELQSLVNGRVDKVYNPNKKELVMLFHVSGEGRKILRVVAGKYLYLTESKDEFGEPSGFCMMLRKHLSNARLKKVEQKGSERVVEFVFEGKEGVKRLIVEFFGQGNIIFCDDSKILSAVEYHKWKDREIAPKIKYEYPKKRYNIFKIKEKEIAELVEGSEKESIVKCLAIELGLGGVYSEEVCLASGVNKSVKPVSLDAGSIKRLYNSLKKLIARKTDAGIVYDNAKVKDIVPFPLKIYDGLRFEGFKTFSEALDYYFSSVAEEVAQEQSQQQVLIKKIKNTIKKQKEQIVKLEEKEVEERKKAEVIYNNYKLLQDIISEVNKAKDKYSWKEIKEKLKEHKVIKEVDAKEKGVLVEVN